MRGEMPLGWDESYGARIGILPRRGSDADVRWFEIDPCYVFHPMNAYVEGDKVICDVGRHAYMWRESMNDFAPSYLYRWSSTSRRARSASGSSTTRLARVPARRRPRGRPAPPLRLGDRAAAGTRAGHGRGGVVLKDNLATGASSDPL